MAGNYYMNMANQRTYNTANPLNYNYPKLQHLKGNQYQNYPKFSEKKEKQENKEQENLAKELENQIKELQKLTKEAKELAKKKAAEDKKETILNHSNKGDVPRDRKLLRKSNLDEVI
jgi:hypothetical protein